MYLFMILIPDCRHTDKVTMAPPDLDEEQKRNEEDEWEGEESDDVLEIVKHRNNTKDNKLRESQDFYLEGKHKNYVLEVSRMSTESDKPPDLINDSDSNYTGSFAGSVED